MSFNIADRVKETTTTTGTGSITLAGAVTGYVSFSSAIGNGNTCYYTIQTQTETEWEVGLGTVSAGVLSRDTVLASSNSGALVNFSAGTKYVFNTEPAIHLKSLVPYTGATESLNLGAYNITATQLIKVGGLATEFLKADGSVDSTTYMNRAVYDTDADGIVDAAMAMRTIGRNSTGATLYKGTVVYISGSTGSRPNFVKAQANSEATSAGTFGVVYADIANNSDGYVVTIGTIDTLDTRTTATNPFTSVTLADGDTVYLDPNTAGYITNVKPSAPNHLVYVGKVTRTSPTNGTIVYRIQNGYELDEIHDVAITSKANNDVLVYESATTLWKNKSIATILGYTPANDSLVMHLAGTETATGYKTFSIGLQTTTGDNYLNYTSGATYIGYNAAPVGGYKLAVNGKQLLEGIFEKKLYTDTSAGVVSAKIGTGYELFGTLHSAGGYTTFLTTTDFSSGWNIIIGNNTYKSLDIQFNRVESNVDLRAKAGMSNITGNGSMSTYFSSPYEGFKPTTSNGWGFGIFNSANSVMAAVKNTGQLLLSNYTSTSVFTGTVAGLLGFDSSGNVITTAASGGISGSGTAGQVTYWTGSSAVGGSSTFTFDSTNDNLAVKTQNTASGSRGISSEQYSSSIQGAVITFKKARGTIATPANVNANDLVGLFSISARVGGAFTSDRCLFGANMATSTGMGMFFNTGSSDGIYAPCMYIQPSGNVQINPGGSIITGVTDSGYRLDVNGTGASTGALRVTGGNVQFGSATGLNWDNTNGRLGIGTGSPSHTLHSFRQESGGVFSGQTAIYGEISNSGLGYGGYFYGNGNGSANRTHYGLYARSGNYSSNTTSIGGYFTVDGGNTGTYTAVVANITNITSVTTAKIFDGQINSVSKFFIDTTGGAWFNGNVGIQQQTASAALDLPSSSTSRASLRIRSGSAPSSPNDGDIWQDGTNMKMYIGGTIKTFTLI